MFLYYYLLLVTNYFLKPARDGLFLVGVGPQRLPIVFMLTAVIVIPVTTLYASGGRKLHLNRLINWTTLILVLNLVLLRWLLNYQHPAVFYVFYIWVSIFGALTTSQFWLMANALFDAAQARRLFVFLGLAGIVGAFTGGELTSFLVHTLHVPTRDLLYVCAALLVTCMGLANLIWARPEPDADLLRAQAPARRPREERLAGTFSIIKRSRYLMMIVGIIAIATAVSSFADYQFKTLSSQAFPLQEDLISFLGKFYGRLSLLSLVIQLFLSYRILKWLGVGGAMLLLPLGLFTGSVTMLATPGLVAGVILRGSEGVFRYSVDKTARELLFLPLPLEVKKRTKVFIDIFVDRWFQGVAGAVLLVLVGVLHFDLRALSIVAIALIVIWFAMASVVRREYVEAFRSALERRQFDLGETAVNLMDTATVRALREALASANERQVVYALDVLRDAGKPDIVDSLIPLFAHDSAEIRAKALLAMPRERGDESRQHAYQLLGNRDATVRREAMSYLCDTAPEGRRACLEYYLAQEVAEFRATAVSCIADSGTAVDQSLVTPPLIESLLATVGPDRNYARRCAAEVLGLLRNPPYRAALEQLIDDPNEEVARTAIRSAGRTGDRGYVPRLLGLMATHRYRLEAREALALYGNRIVGTIGDQIIDPSVAGALRARLCRVLSRIPTQQSVDMLFGVLSKVETSLRYNVIKALNFLRSRHPELKFTHDALGGVLLDESRSYYAILQILDVGGASDTPADCLLERSLRQKMDANLERIFRLLGLRYGQDDLHGAYLGITSGQREPRASALEFLDNVLKREVKRYLIPIVDNLAVDLKIRRGDELFDLGIRDAAGALEYLIGGDDPWLRSCALYAAAGRRLPGLAALAARCAQDPDPVVQETARLVMANRER